MEDYLHDESLIPYTLHNDDLHMPTQYYIKLDSSLVNNERVI